MKIVKLYTLLIFFFISACSAPNTSEKLDPQAFKAKMESSESKLILDVRTPEEFKVEHLKGSSNLNIYDSHFESSIEGLDKESPIFVYCKSGNRSSKASKLLSKAGFKEVYELEGGINSWKSNKFELDEKETKPVALKYTLEQYNQIIDSNKLVLVDFMADWCGPCKKMAPHIEKIKAQYPEKLTVLKIDTDKNQELSQEFKVSGIPALRIYSEGKEVAVKVGYQTEEQLLAILQPYL